MQRVSKEEGAREGGGRVCKRGRKEGHSEDERKRSRWKRRREKRDGKLTRRSKRASPEHLRATELDLSPEDRQTLRALHLEAAAQAASAPDIACCGSC